MASSIACWSLNSQSVSFSCNIRSDEQLCVSVFSGVMTLSLMMLEQLLFHSSFRFGLWMENEKLQSLWNTWKALWNTLKSHILSILDISHLYQKHIVRTTSISVEYLRSVKHITKQYNSMCSDLALHGNSPVANYRAMVVVYVYPPRVHHKITPSTVFAWYL